jgi:hypothetical protein
MQDPSVQTTAPAKSQGQMTPQQKQQFDKEQQKERQEKGSTSSFASRIQKILPPGTNPTDTAMGLDKMGDNKPLDTDDQKGIASIPNLVALAAQYPQTKDMLGTALLTAVDLAKKGK